MASSPSEGAILTIKEVAEYLKVTERTIYRLAAAKQIPAFKVGGAGGSRVQISMPGSRSSPRKVLGLQSEHCAIQLHET
jgi:excisionase family DNA binding protein